MADTCAGTEFRAMLDGKVISLLCNPKPSGPYRNRITESRIEYRVEWRRFFARIFDLWLSAIPISFILWSAIPFTPAAEFQVSSIRGQSVLIGLISLPLWLVIESWLISTFKTTPGKWVWGITLGSENGESISLSKAANRCLSVWGSGLYFGIPGISIIALIVKAYHPERLVYVFF